MDTAWNASPRLSKTFLQSNPISRTNIVLRSESNFRRNVIGINYPPQGREEAPVAWIASLYGGGCGARSMGSLWGITETLRQCCEHIGQLGAIGACINWLASYTKKGDEGRAAAVVL